jgi:hypothetical protein
LQNGSEYSAISGLKFKIAPAILFKFIPPVYNFRIIQKILQPKAYGKAPEQQ